MTIDERLEFLLHSTESLHATVQEQTRQLQEQGRQLRELDERERKHWGRITRALQAALEGWLEEDSDEEEPTT